MLTRTDPLSWEVGSQTTDQHDTKTYTFRRVRRAALQTMTATILSHASNPRLRLPRHWNGYENLQAMSRVLDSQERNITFENPLPCQ
eukprot:813048-Amphidinium_carterae.2